MKKIFKNIFLAFVLPGACLLASCDKNNRLEQQGKPISVTAAAVETKSMLDATSFQSEGNEIQIYDYVGTSSTPHINDQIIAPSSTTPEYHWPFASGEKHQWTPGVHKFFGWLSKDANMPDNCDTPEDFFKVIDANTQQETDNFGFANKVINIPAKLMTATTPQFDFMYSDIHTRDMDTDPVYTAVPLRFSHLFTAFSVSALNTSTSNTITVTGITISGLQNKKSATIDYSVTDSDKPNVNYTKVDKVESENSDITYSIANGGVELDADAKPISDFLLMWPQTEEDFKDDTITVYYNYTEGISTTSNSKKVPLSSLTSWEPGTKNTIKLAFTDKEIELTCIVKPWTCETQEIDFSEVIAVSTTMYDNWQNVFDVNYDTGEVILKQSKDEVATVNFQIDSPRGATWTASLIMIQGTTDAVQFVEGYKYGKVGEPGQIRLRVSKDSPIENRNSYYLRITVQTADGNTIVVTNGLTGSNNYSEFKIIQNLIF